MPDMGLPTTYDTSAVGSDIFAPLDSLYAEATQSPAPPKQGRGIPYIDYMPAGEHGEVFAGDAPSLTAAPEPSMLARPLIWAREGLSPLLGPTPVQAQRDAVLVPRRRSRGEIERPVTDLGYKPAGSAVDREGFLFAHPDLPKWSNEGVQRFLPDFAPDWAGQYIGGVERGVANLGESLLNPLTALLPGASTVPGVGRAVSALFGAQMLSHLPEQVSQLAESQNIGDVMEHGIGTAGSAVFGYKGMEHAVRGAQPQVANPSSDLYGQRFMERANRPRTTLGDVREGGSPVWGEPLSMDQALADAAIAGRPFNQPAVVNGLTPVTRLARPAVEGAKPAEIVPPGGTGEAAAAVRSQKPVVSAENPVGVSVGYISEYIALLRKNEQLTDAEVMELAQHVDRMALAGDVTGLQNMQSLLKDQVVEIARKGAGSEKATTAGTIIPEAVSGQPSAVSQPTQTTPKPGEPVAPVAPTPTPVEGAGGTSAIDTKQVPIEEAPVNQITLSKDVPNFKGDADPNQQSLFGSESGAVLVPSGVVKAGEWLRPKDAIAITGIKITHRDILPDFQPIEVESSIANQLYGMERIPGAGRLVSMNQGARTPQARRFITHMGMRTKGNNIASRVHEELNAELGPSPKLNEQGQLLGVTPNRKGLSLHPDDVFRKWYVDRDAYTLSPEVEAAFRKYAQIKMAGQALLRKYRPVDASQPGLPGMESDFDQMTLPRPVIGKRDPVTGKTITPTQVTGGARLGSKQAFEKKRLYETEEQGAVTTVYEPDLHKRMSGWVKQVYRAIADDLLVNDPVFGGQTPTERLPKLLAHYAEDIKAGRMSVEHVRTLAEHPFLTKEGVVHEPAFAGQIFPEDVANYLNSVLKTETDPGWHALRSATYLTKGWAYGLDATQVLLQIPQITAANVPAGGKSLLHSAWTLFGDVNHMQSYYRQHAKAMREMSQLGRPFGDPTDLMVGASKGHVIGELPVIGRLARRTSAAFGAALDTGAIELWESLSPKYDQAKWPELMNWINSVTMRGRRQAVGPRQVLVEDAMLGASNMARAAGDLVANAHMKGVSGNLTRKLIAKYVAGASAIVAGIGLAQNQDKEDILDRLNPSSPRWLSFQIKTPSGGRIEVGLGGPLKSALRAYANTLTSAVTDPSKLVQIDSAANPVLRYLRGRLGPVTGGALDAWSGSDYLGRDVGPLDVARKRALPLSWQNAFPGIETDSPPQWTAAPEMLGAITYRESPSSQRQRLQNELAKQRYGGRYDALRVPEQSMIQHRVDQMPNRLEFTQTRRQAAGMVDATKQRRQNVLTQLPADVRQQVATPTRVIPTWDNSIKAGWHPLRLTFDQSKQFDALMSKHYAAELTKAVRNPTWNQVSELSRDRRILHARELAKNKATREFRNQADQKKPRLSRAP